MMQISRGPSLEISDLDLVCDDNKEDEKVLSS